MGNITTQLNAGSGGRRRDPVLRSLDASDAKPPINYTLITTLAPTLKTQLEAAGLGSPDTLNLFPDTPPGALDSYYSPGHNAVVGASPHNALIFDINQFLQEIPPTRVDDPKCASDRLANDKFPVRVFFAIHEVAHYVAHHLNLNDNVYNAMLHNDSENIARAHKLIHGPFGDEVRWHAEEVLADTAATLYILSNYKLPTDGTDVLTTIRNYREATIEASHYSVSSINKALAAFRDNPKPKGLTIVDATRWAADIISKQPGLLGEFVEADTRYTNLMTYEDLYWQSPAALIDGITHLPNDVTSGRLFVAAAKARDALCALAPHQTPIVPQGNESSASTLHQIGTFVMRWF